MKRNQVEKLKELELEILKEFIQVCEKIGVDYYLIGGTLLGAIRHKGFIPWDDDIDVCMMREDYNKLIKEGQKYLNKKYFLQTYETDHNYPQCFAKIRNNETTFLETSVSDIIMNHGVYIDIFPLDNYHKISKIQKLKLYLINVQLFKKYYRENKKHNKQLIKLLYLLSKIVYRKKSNQELCKLKDKIIQNNNNSSTYVTNYSGAWGIKKETHKKDDFGNYIMMDFENIKCKVPKGYNNILTNMYGNYMKLPPKDKRVAHHYTDVIDLNKPYTEYINKKENL